MIRHGSLRLTGEGLACNPYRVAQGTGWVIVMTIP